MIESWSLTTKSSSVSSSFKISFLEFYFLVFLVFFLVNFSVLEAKNLLNLLTLVFETFSKDFD